jgi:alcohol dehydrogenase
LLSLGSRARLCSIQNLPDPRPGPGEVVVKIEAAGVRGRDLVVRKGAFPHVKLPVVPGHEGVGRVVEVGPGVEKEPVGAGVSLSAVYDGTCEYCRRGLENLCKSAEPLGESRNGTYIPRPKRHAPNNLYLPQYNQGRTYQSCLRA